MREIKVLTDISTMKGTLSILNKKDFHKYFFMDAMSIIIILWQLIWVKTLKPC
jgi:hypothetical protein